MIGFSDLQDDGDNFYSWGRGLVPDYQRREQGAIIDVFPYEDKFIAEAVVKSGVHTIEVAQRLGSTPEEAFRSLQVALEDLQGDSDEMALMFTKKQGLT